MYVDINGHKSFFSNGDGNIKPEQRSVVFLHGAAMDHTVWVLPARYFSRHNYNVYAFGFPGHVRSESALCNTIDAMSDWRSNAMTALDINSAAIVGHSMGSLVVLNFASRYPQSTRVLALLGTSTLMPVADPLMNAAKRNHHDAIDMANTWSHSDIGQLGGNEMPGNCMTMGGQRLLERAREDVFFNDLKACNEFRNGDELVSSIAADTLVIVGAQDKLTAVVSAHKGAANIPSSRVVNLSPCGHTMLSEQPNAVLDALSSIV